MKRSRKRTTDGDSSYAHGARTGGPGTSGRISGGGTSTVGKALSARLSVPFVELDARVEEAAGLSLREIFELHGEEYYRRLEREALEALISKGESSILATGGGIVTHPETFDV